MRLLFYSFSTTVTGWELHLVEFLVLASPRRMKSGPSSHGRHGVDDILPPIGMTWCLGARSRLGGPLQPVIVKGQEYNRTLIILIVLYSHYYRVGGPPKVYMPNSYASANV